METTAKNNTSGTHQEKAKKLRKLRRWQIAVSLLGAAIVVWGVIEVVCLFLDYKQTEVSNDAQIEQYISPINLRASADVEEGWFLSPLGITNFQTVILLLVIVLIVGFFVFIAAMRAANKKKRKLARQAKLRELARQQMERERDTRQRNWPY